MKKLNSLAYAFILVFLLFAGQARSQCTVNAGSDVSVYPGLPPMDCATLTAVPTGSGSYSYSWSNGATTASITVCDAVTTVYWVTVTDSAGCISTDSVTVNAVDVRCGNGNKKVKICHIPPGNPGNAHSICVSINAVAAHLAHGDHLGDCVAPPPNPCLSNPPVASAVADSIPDSLGCRNLTGSVSGGTAPYMYIWNTGAVGTTLYVCDTLTTTYVFTVTDANGCSDSASVTVGQTPPPTCTVNLGNDTSLCASGSYVLHAGPGFLTYMWSDSSSADSLVVTQSGTYWVTVSDSATGCTASDTISLVLFTAPVVTAVADSLPDSLGCRNINTLIVGNSFPFEYSWSTGDSTASIYVCDSVTTTYTVLVTDSNGCSSSASVTVDQPVSCSVDLGNDTSVCATSPYVLHAGAGFITYLWSDSSTADTLAVTQSGTYWVQVSDSSTGCLASDTVAIVFFSAPVVTAFADSIPDSLGCRNINALTTGGTIPYTYIWSTGQNLVTIQVCDSVTTSYWVTVTDVNGCSSTDSVTIEIPITCSVNLGADTSVCSADSLVLDAGTSFHTFLWSDSSSAQTLSITQSGSYWVQATDTVTGCMASDTIAVMLFDSPIAAAVADSVPDSLGCVNLTASVTGGTAPFTYSWSNGDSTLVINVCDSLTATYTFTVVDSNGCSSSAFVTVNDTGSRPIRVAGRGRIEIQPNPFMDNARIGFVLPESGKVLVELYDMNGSRLAILYQGNVTGNIPYQVDFNGSDLIQGVYFLRLTKSDGTTIQKKMVLFRY